MENKETWESHPDEQIRQVIIDLEPRWTRKNVEFDIDMDEALTMTKTLDEYQYQVSMNLSR